MPKIRNRRIHKRHDRVRCYCPYLYHVFNPQSDENEVLSQDYCGLCAVIQQSDSPHDRGINSTVTHTSTCTLLLSICKSGFRNPLHCLAWHLALWVKVLHFSLPRIKPEQLWIKSNNNLISYLDCPPPHFLTILIGRNSNFIVTHRPKF
jgi:hypothetical protein